MAAAGASIGVGVAALGAKDTFNNSRTQADYDSAIHLQTATNVGWVTAGVLGGLGATLIVVSIVTKPSPAATSSAWMELGPRGGQARGALLSVRRAVARGLVAAHVAALLGCADAGSTRALSSAAPATPTSATVSSLAPSASASATATTTAPARAVRYLALGDSFTIGTGSSPAQAFPARLAARIESSGVPVALENLGVNGFTTEDLERVELPHVAEFAPNLVTLAIGATDLVHGSTVEAYQARARRILAEIVARGVSAGRIVCLPQPRWQASPVGGELGDVAQTAQKITQFNAAFREEAKRAGAVWADLDALFEKQAAARMFAGDGLHPSAAAHDAWAAELAPIALRVLAVASESAPSAGDAGR